MFAKRCVRPPTKHNPKVLFWVRVRVLVRVSVRVMFRVRVRVGVRVRVSFEPLVCKLCPCQSVAEDHDRYQLLAYR